MKYFKVGDRVRVRELLEVDTKDTDLRKGDTGEIVRVKGVIVGVRFDRDTMLSGFNYDSSSESYDMYGYQLEKIEEEKDMRLSDLRTGMVVETKGGDRYLVLQVEGGILFMGAEGSNYMKSWVEPKHEEDMTCGDDDSTIMKVFRPVHVFQHVMRTTSLLWERQQEQELTVEEISRRLGYPVKVVAHNA